MNRMTFKKAAYYILREKKRPLSAKEITKFALKSGLITSQGKTPEATMGTQIYTDINKKGEESLFVKVERGLFGLREWDEEICEEEANPVDTPPAVTSIIKNLKEKQFKSESPTDFEEALKDAFNLLGFKGELIGGKGDTDVLLTANIGQESFKVNVDGKTSKSGKVPDQQIDWDSLEDHKKKNSADFVVVVGPDFSGGNLERRANDHDVALLKTKELVQLMEVHTKFPFTLLELKDLFADKGDTSSQSEDLLTQNLARRNLVERFRVIIEEMQSLQDRLGYFTFDSLAGRERIEELEIEPEDIKYIIDLLNLPFINGVEETSGEKYILTIKTKDIANIFQQISNLLTKPSHKEELTPEPVPEIEEEPEPEEQLGSKYFDWEIKGHSVVAFARKDNPYKHYCPVKHFKTIADEIINIFQEVNVLGVKEVHESLKGKNLAKDRPYKGKAERYKIRVCLGVMELEEFLKWTGSKRPIEYKLNTTTNNKIEDWVENNIQSQK